MSVTSLYSPKRVLLFPKANPSDSVFYLLQSEIISRLYLKTDAFASLNSGYFLLVSVPFLNKAEQSFNLFQFLLHVPCNEELF